MNFPLYSEIPVPLKIQTTENGLVTLENGQEIASAEIIQPPDWYNKNVEGYPITSILTQHNDQVVGSVYEWCSLFNTGEQCKFCVIDRSQKDPDLRSITKKSELILKALEQIPREQFRGIGLNGGMTFSPGRGIESFLPLMQNIRSQFGNLPIAVETTPPTDTEWIDKFAEAGGSSLMMNLETWDDKIRQNLIPGKNRYCQKETYLKAFEKAVQVLGKGKVSSCFVVGTEPTETLKEGIREVVNYDVIPSPLAGRYFEQFKDYPFQPNTNWKEFLEIFTFARSEMAKAGLISTDTAGCVACGMCDIIGD